MDEKVLVKVLAFMACTVTVGWFVAFIILPAVRSPEYRPAPEITMLMGTVFTGLAGSLGAAYYKARNPKDTDPEEAEPPDPYTDQGDDNAD